MEHGAQHYSPTDAGHCEDEEHADACPERELTQVIDGVHSAHRHRFSTELFHRLTGPLIEDVYQS